jgi:hypothetical protein
MNLSFLTHAIRKALCLSMTEMAVLDQVESLSNRAETQYSCIKSPDKIADDLDVDRATVFRAFKALTEKGYIEKMPRGYAPTDFIRDLVCSEEVGLILKTRKGYLITAKVRELMGNAGYVIRDEQAPDLSQNATGFVAKCDTSVAKCDNHIVNNLVVQNRVVVPTDFNDVEGGIQDAGERPQPPAIPEGPRVVPAERKKKKHNPLADKIPGYSSCVALQDAFCKANGLPGVHMNDKEGRCLKSLLSGLRTNGALEAGRRGYTGADVEVWYLGILHSMFKDLTPFHRQSMLTFSGLLGNLPKLAFLAVSATPKPTESKQKYIDV